MAGKLTFGTDQNSKILSFKAGFVFHLERSCLVVLITKLFDDIELSAVFLCLGLSDRSPISYLLPSAVSLL
jgi:hypothetical protein